MTDLPPGYEFSAVDENRAEVDATIAAVQTQLGNRVGFIQFTPDGETVTVPVVGLSSYEEDQIDSLEPASIDFDAVVAPASASELRDLLSEIQTSTAGMSAREVVYAIDVKYSLVEVGVPPATTAAEEAENAAILQEAGAIAETFADEIDVAGRMGVQDAGAELVFDDPVTAIAQDAAEVRGNLPVHGGRWVNIDLGCTAGYSMIMQDGSTWRLTAAGHCGTYGDQVAMANSGETVGTVFNDEPSGYDVLAYSLPSGHDRRAVLTVREGGNFRQVAGQRNKAQQHSGDDYCYTGRGTIANNPGEDERCGDFHKIVMNGSIEEHCIERRGYGGDSGAPMYAFDSGGRAIAVGTVTRTLTLEHPIFADDHFVCFPAIDEILDAFNYSLATEK